MDSPSGKVSEANEIPGRAPMRRGQPGEISTETGLAAAPFHFGPDR